MRTSDSLSALAPALVKAAAELTNPKRTATAKIFSKRTGKSFSYSYTPLAAILDNLRPVLAAHGLCAVQSAGNGVTTMIVHESGEWIETDPLVVTPKEDDPQGIGGAVTYARRYSLAAALGIASEDDDDANHASGNTGQSQPQGQAAPPQSAPPPSGEIEPKKHDGDGFEMDHYPAHKSGDHVFSKGPNAGRWNGKTWAELAKLHGALVQSGGDMADSPIADMMASKFMGAWNKEHAAYLDMQIRASVQPPPPTEPVCPECGKPGDGQLCGECLDKIPF